MAVDVVIRKLDESYIYIDCEEDIAYELRGHFTYTVDGYWWNPQYKYGNWDGKIRIFNIRNKTIYTGLLARVILFCKRMNYSYKLENFEIPSKIGKEDFSEFIDKLSVCAGGKRIQARDYQLEYAKKAIDMQRMVLVSPTSSGKSLMIYFICQFLQQYILQDTSEKILLLVPNKNLVAQMAGDFEDYASDIQWNMEDNCHLIFAGQDKDSSKQIYISTWQSIYKQPNNYFKKFSAIIVDECHGAEAKCLKQIAEKCKTAVYRYGTSGTLKDIKSHRLVLEGLFGPIEEATTIKNLIDQNHSPPVEVEAINLKYDKEACKFVAGMDYQKEIDFITQNKKRRKLVIQMAKNIPGNTLILFQRKDKHGVPMFEEAQKEILNRPLYYVSGDTDVDEREQIRHIVEKENQAIVFATYGVFSTGVNIKRIHNIVFASPYKSRIKVLQSLGRGLRIAEGKDKLKLYDIVDVLKHRNRKNYTYKHFLERMKIYKEQLFPVKIVNIQFRSSSRVKD